MVVPVHWGYEVRDLVTFHLIVWVLTLSVLKHSVCDMWVSIGIREVFGS